MKKKLLLFLLNLCIFLSPAMVWAYSDQIIVGGDNIGIHIDSKGIIVIGFYKVDGEYQKGNPEIRVGDFITKVNKKEVSSIEELTNAIDKYLDENKIILTIKREEKTFETELTLKNIDGIYKTGLYVKDGISGIGTLTYIDPGTKIFGTLGHEILESSSNKRIEVKTGTIFDSEVSKIIKSSDGTVGEKNANLNFNHIYGKIKKNTLYGVFGDYTADIPNGKIFQVGKPEEITTGPATIYTVLTDNKIGEYNIEITNINNSANIKNITFEITDERLLNETGGVIQGMSGSPIIQNGKIVGAVTHAIVDNVKNGYGIFITTMLKEGES